MIKRTTNNRPQLTWAQVVLKALRSREQAMTLAELNSYVEARAGKLLKANHNWQAKIRQVCQRLRDQGLAENVSSGVWKAKGQESRDVDGTNG